MSTKSTTAEGRLAKLGIHPPNAPRVLSVNVGAVRECAQATDSVRLTPPGKCELRRGPCLEDFVAAW